MKEIYKQSDKDLSKVFFNSVEEMNDCYGIDAELPSKLYSNADLVCYEIVEPFVFERIGQYMLTDSGVHHLNNIAEPVNYNCNELTSESGIFNDDLYRYEGRCFVYVRVNEYLRKHLEKTLIGCEFVSKDSASYFTTRRFIKCIDIRLGKLVILDQLRFCTPFDNILLYPDDHSDPIPYKEWVKKINEQDVEGED